MTNGNGFQTESLVFRLCTFSKLKRMKSYTVHFNGYTSPIKTTEMSVYDKGVFSKPSGKHVHSCTISLFLELETSNFGYLLIFSSFFGVQSFSKIGQH